MTSAARILPSFSRLDHRSARQLSEAVRRRAERSVAIDCTRVADASTDGFAELIALRREMLRRGTDFKLFGLSGRAMLLHAMNRLANVLPVEPALAT